MNKKIGNVFRFFIRLHDITKFEPAAYWEKIKRKWLACIHTNLLCHPPLQQRNVMEDNNYYTC